MTFRIISMVIFSALYDLHLYPGASLTHFSQNSTISCTCYILGCCCLGFHYISNGPWMLGQLITITTTVAVVLLPSIGSTHKLIIFSCRAIASNHTSLCSCCRSCCHIVSTSTTDEHNRFAIVSLRCRDVTHLCVGKRASIQLML